MQDQRVFIRFFRRYIGISDIDVQGHVFNHHRRDSSLDFVCSSVPELVVNLLPDGSNRILVKLPVGDYCLYGKTATPNAWIQIWPREAAKTALAMMHVARRGRFGLPKEIARQIGMQIFAGRDVPCGWGDAIVFPPPSTVIK